MAAKVEKWNLPLVEKQRIWYNILHDAPSPSGKAGDFDSPIVGSTPAGATARASEIIVNLMISEALSFLLFVF